MSTWASNPYCVQPPLIQFYDVTNPANWPKAPSRKCCLYEATNLVGLAMFGGEWTGQELLVRAFGSEPDPANVSNAPPPITPLASSRRNTEADHNARREFEIGRLTTERKLWRMNQEVFQRLENAVEWIAQRCRDGELISYYRLESGGPLVAMAAHEWNVDQPLFNFWVEGGPDLEVPAYARRFTEQVYMFMDRAELSDELSAFFLPRVKLMPSKTTLLSTGDPGRPSKGYHIYAAEHERRCANGQAFTVLEKEADYLVAWYAREHPLADPIKRGTVMNRIRARHRAHSGPIAHKIIDQG